MKAPSLYVQTIARSWGDIPIRFGARGPWSQPYFMDLVCVGEFVLAYLLNCTSYRHETSTIGYNKDWRLEGCVKVLWHPHQIWSYGPVKSAMFHGLVWVGWFVVPYLLNPTSYGHETCTIGYSKDWRLKGCAETLWQPHQMWSYGPMKSAMFHGFGLGWLICGTISPEPYKLWTWDLYHWIQQRLTFKRMCRNTVTTPSDVKLWTHEISYVSWIWFMWVNSCWHIHIYQTLLAMDMRLASLLRQVH